MTTLADYRDERLRKLQEIKDKGINPYPSKSNRNTTINKVLDDFDAYDGKEVTIAGRITAIRSFGKLAFVKIRDYFGEVQIFMQANGTPSASKSEISDGLGGVTVAGSPEAELEARTHGEASRQDPEHPVAIEPARAGIPVISLSESATDDSWTITQDGDKFIVSGVKIEKFARRTDFSNYAAVNRLRDIMKKMGIRAELTSKGAKDDSIISIAGHEFTLVEDW